MVMVLAPRRVPPRAAWSARGQQRPQVDAAVPDEATIFGGDHRRRQRWRDVGQRHPVETTSHGIDPAGGEHHAVAIEQADVGRAVRGADGVEGGRRGTGCVQGKSAEHERDRQRAARSCHRVPSITGPSSHSSVTTTATPTTSSAMP